MHRTRRKNPAIAAAMARTGKSGQVLANETGLHFTTISSILNNRRIPKPETAKSIARALNCSLAELGFSAWEDVR